MSAYPYEFEAPLELHGVGRTRVVSYTVLFLPPSLAAALPFDRSPRLRVRAEFGDVPVSGAWIPAGDGRRYFIVSSAVRKATGARIGTMLMMRFGLDDPDRVEIPDALVRVLAADPIFAAAWSAATPGRRRGLAYFVSTAVSAATVAKRIAAVRADLVDGVPVMKRTRTTPR